MKAQIFLTDPPADSAANSIEVGYRFTDEHGTVEVVHQGSTFQARWVQPGEIVSVVGEVEVPPGLAAAAIDFVQALRAFQRELKDLAHLGPQ